LANVKQIFSPETPWPNPSLAPFGQAVSEEKVLLTVANQKQELLLVAMFVENFLIWFHSANEHGRQEQFFFSDWLMLKKSSPLKLLTKKLYRGSYIDASCQDWLHLAKQFQRRRFV
jgi:hypothetical protein